VILHVDGEASENSKLHDSHVTQFLGIRFSRDRHADRLELTPMDDENPEGKPPVNPV
jgi:hypothetical protein